jgi:tripartite-type tricarboxylate transporter receptor subunit TctC
VLVHPSLPVKTLGELVELARKSPKPLTYGSGGNGSSQHLAGALFAHMAGLTLTHVAYKGGNPAQLDLMAGNLDMMIIQPNAKEVVTSGKLRALAVSSPQRSPDYPDVPTVAEAGLPGYQSVAWYGLVGPKNMPPELLKKLSAETIRAVAAPAVRAVIATQGGSRGRRHARRVRRLHRRRAQALRIDRARSGHGRRISAVTARRPARNRPAACRSAP